MKKELLFSFVGHLALFLILVSVTKPQKRGKLYPEVFQVSVVNLESGSQTTTQTSAVSIVEKKPKDVKPKVTKDNKKPVQQIKTGKTGNNLGLKISSKGGKYSYYIDAILTKIGSNWVNPFAGSGIKFSATIYFVIQKDGRITSAKIEKSSGNELYDRSAERAVIITQMLPPLAGEFENQDSLKLHLEFEYKR